ncbi:Fc.00g037360.m01.CDS01 [Cosmosporella sp. VM-42]
MVAIESPSSRPPDTRLFEGRRLRAWPIREARHSPPHTTTTLTPTAYNRFPSNLTSSTPHPRASPPETPTSTPVARQRAFDAAELSKPRPSTSSNDRHDRHEPTSTPQQRQQLSATPRPLLQQSTQQSSDSVERLSTPSSQPRSLRRTPKFEAPPTPEPRQVHLAAASVGFTPKAAVARVDDLPEHHPTILGLAPLLAAERQPPRRRRRLSQDLTEDIDEESSIRPQSVPPRPASAFALRDRPGPHPALRISKHTHSAILFTLEEALRKPNPFTPDIIEESAQMADIMSSGGVPPPSNGKPATFRGTGAPNPTGSPSGIRGPRMIMQERAAREARQRAEAEQLERQRAEEEARLLQEARRRDAEGRPPAGVAAGQGSGVGKQDPSDPRRQGHNVPETTSSRQRPATSSQAPPQRPARNTATTQQVPPQTFTAPVPVTQPQFGAQTGETSAPVNTGGKSRNAFPHAFERWETLSAHWEGLTSYWIRKLEQNKDEINRDPINQQLGRQVTDLSAAGANLFHAVVELQRLRASSERKFQRWFFETRAELERAQEVNAMLEAALEQERRGRADAIRDAVENQRGTSKAEKQLVEMRKELAISKEEARRAWEELGRREQEERDRTLSLQSGQPTIVGGVQVVPMTQGAPSRHTSTRQGTYQSEYGQGYPPEQTTSPQGPPPTTSAGPGELYPPQQGAGGYTGGGSEGGYSEGEYVIDANGNFILDAQGRKIPFAAAPSTYTGSDVDAEDYETPATTNPPSGGKEPPSSSAGSSAQWTGTYSEPQDYSGSGYGAPGWETVPRHHHPTRLSDVIEEEDERSRTSASHSRV